MRCDRAVVPGRTLDRLTFFLGTIPAHFALGAFLCLLGALTVSECGERALDRESGPLKAIVTIWARVSNLCQFHIVRQVTISLFIANVTRCTISNDLSSSAELSLRTLVALGSVS